MNVYPDTMDFCFFCDDLLLSTYTQISSSFTPHSNVSYLEKICEILGAKYVIIANSSDYICMDCTSYLIRMDRLENEVQLIKDKILSQILDTFRRTPIVENAYKLKENLMADKQQNPSQLKLPSSSTSRQIPTIPFTQVETSIKILKIQPQQKQKGPHVQNQQQVQKQQHDGANRIKIKECRTLLQKPTHLNQKEMKNQIVTQPAGAKVLTLVRQKKKMKYRCSVCFSLFDNQLLYHKHVREKHMEATLISSRESAKIYAFPHTSNISKLQITTPQKNKKMESPMYKYGNQQDNKKGTVDASMMLNYHVPAQKYAVTEQLEETDNSSKANTVAVNVSSPVPEKIYHIKGLLCSTCYKSRINYVNELEEENMRLTKSISNREREIKYSWPDTFNNSKLQIPPPQNNQEVESPMHIDDKHQDNKKGTVDAGTMLNHNVPDLKSADTDQMEETDDSSKAYTVKETKSINSYGLTVEEKQQKQDGANRMEIFECSTHVQLQKPTHINQIELENHIFNQTAAAKILTPKKNFYFNCQVCSKMYDVRSLDLEQLNKKNKMSFISNRESEKNFSYSHTSLQQNQEMESPMDMDDTVDASMMMNYNVPAKKSALTEQAEETDNYSEANTAAANILSAVPQMKKRNILGLACFKCYGSESIYLKKLEEENKRLTTYI